MLADIGMKMGAARQLIYVTASKSQRKDHDLGFFSAAAKTFTSDAAKAIATDAVQLLGGAGYVIDHPVERMMHNAKIIQICEGTNQAQRLVLGRSLLNRGAEKVYEAHGTIDTIVVQTRVGGV